jgi:hypothetical protein
MPTTCRLAHHDTVLPCSSRSGLATATPDLVERSRRATPGGYDAQAKACRLPDDNAKSSRKPAVSGRRSGRTTRQMSELDIARSRAGRFGAIPVMRGEAGHLIDANRHRSVAANRGRLCHPCGIAAGPHAPVEGLGRGVYATGTLPSRRAGLPSPANPRAAAAGTVAGYEQRRRRSLRSIQTRRPAPPPPLPRAIAPIPLDLRPPGRRSRRAGPVLALASSSPRR